MNSLSIRDPRLPWLMCAFERSPVSICVTNTDADILFVNPRFCATTGYAAREAVGQNIRILKSERMPPHVYAGLWQALASDGEWHGELLNRRKDGACHWERLSIAAVRDHEGQVQQYVSIMEDVQAPAHGEAGASQTATAPGGRTLLLVDDEPGVLNALTRLFRRDGYRILTAQSGVEALEKLAGEPVHVIISDQRMPQMSGTEFLARAKTLYPDTIRIVLSGYTELSAVTDAINHGAIYQFLTKPWNDEMLRDNVRRAFVASDQAASRRRGAA